MSTWQMTYVNAQGESIASAPGILVNTNLNDAAQFTVPALSSLAGWIRGLASAYQPASVNVYEADVAHRRGGALPRKLCPGRQFRPGRHRHGDDNRSRGCAALVEYRPGHSRRPAAPTDAHRRARLGLGQLSRRARCLRDRHLHQRSRRNAAFRWPAC